MCAATIEAAEVLPQAVVLSPENPGPIDTASLLLAMTVQLKPFQWRVKGVTWSRPKTVAQQQQLAARLGRQGAASAVIWFTQQSKAKKSEIAVHVLELTGEKSIAPALRSLSMGPPRAGIERSMALAARTILQAKLDSIAEARASPKASASGAKDKETQLVSALSDGPPEGVLLGAGYGVELYPLGLGVRHGPDLHLSLIRGNLQGRLTFGYRFEQGGADEQSTWSSQVLSIGPSLAYLKALPHRLWLLVGLQAKIRILFSEAQSRVDDRRESERASELSLGAYGGLAYAWGKRFMVELCVGIHWIPWRYQLLIRGTEQASSGPLEISFLPTLHVKLF